MAGFMGFTGQQEHVGKEDWSADHKPAMGHDFNACQSGASRLVKRMRGL
jgi:hypothetical protein